MEVGDYEDDGDDANGVVMDDGVVCAPLYYLLIGALISGCF